MTTDQNSELADSIRDIINQNGTGAKNPAGGAQASDTDAGDQAQQSLRVSAARPAPSVPHPAPHANFTNGPTRASDEFSYQEARQAHEISMLAADINALDESMNIDEARMNDLRLSYEQKLAARQRLVHLHTAGTRHLEDLRSYKN